MASQPTTTIHTASQPASRNSTQPSESTKAPWATGTVGSASNSGVTPMRAPWAADGGTGNGRPAGGASMLPPTRAPWADKKPSPRN